MILLLELFLSFLQVGLFSIGGGYAALPLIQTQIVDKHGWLTLTEFADVITISQMTPGPIAINAATFVGTKVAGFAGAIVATLGCVTPSFIIVLLLAYIYTKYKELKALKGALSALRPAVVALIGSAAVSIITLSFWGGGAVVWSLSAIDFIAVALFAVGLFVLRKWKPSPIVVMLAAGVVGGAVYYLGGAAL